jgi:SAM-dependent methyltransferase
MRKAIRTSVGLFVESFAPEGPVVEIGSFHPAGGESLSDLRGLFAGKKYIGCDIRPGNGVDRIEDAHALTFPAAFAGTMVLCEILEHLPDPARAVAEAHRVLREDGLLVVSVPFRFRLHGFPSDYWRFTSSGLHTLLAAFHARTVFALGPRLKPALVFAVASKTDSAGFAERARRFEERVEAAFRASRWQGVTSELKERGRDFFGCLLGRADLRANFFHPDGRSGFPTP